MSEMTVRHVAIMQRLFLLALRKLDWNGEKLASHISAVLMAHEFTVVDENSNETDQGRNYRRHRRRDNEEKKDTTKARLFSVKSIEQLRDSERFASVSSNLSAALEVVRADMIFIPPGLQATLFVDLVTSECASMSVSVTYSAADIVANMQSKKCGNFVVSVPSIEGIDAASLTPTLLGGADRFDDYQKLLVGRLGSDIDFKPSYVLSPLRPAGSHGPTFKARFAGMELTDLERSEAPATVPQNDHDFIHSLRASDLSSVETAGQVHALVDSDDTAKRFSAAGHPLLSDEDLMTLLAEGNVDVDNVLASRSDISSTVLKTLVSRFHHETLRVLVSSHNETTIREIENSLSALDDEKLSRVVNALSYSDVIAEFISKTSSVQLISRIMNLSTNKTAFIGIARRENVPSAFIPALLNSPLPVLIELVKSSNLSDSQVIEIVKNNNVLKIALAERPRLSVGLARTLLCDKDEAVRAAVIRHWPSSETNTLVEIANNQNLSFNENIALIENPATPDALAIQISKSSTERLAYAGRNNASVAGLRILLDQDSLPRPSLTLAKTLFAIGGTSEIVAFLRGDIVDEAKVNNILKLSQDDVSAFKAMVSNASVKQLTLLLTPKSEAILSCHPMIQESLAVRVIEMIKEDGLNEISGNVLSTLALFKSNIFGSQQGVVAKSLASMEGGFFVLSASQWLDQNTRDGIFANLLDKLGLPVDAVSTPISAIYFAQNVFSGELALRSRYETLSTAEKIQFNLLGQKRNSAYELAAVALSALGVQTDPRFKMMFTEHCINKYGKLMLQEESSSALGLQVRVWISTEVSLGIVYLGAHHAVALKSKASPQEVTRCLLASLSESDGSSQDNDEENKGEEPLRKSTNNILSARLVSIGRGKESAKDILSSLGINGAIAQKIVIAAMSRGESADWIQGFVVMWRGLRQVSRDKLEEDLASFSTEVASKRQKDIETTETNLVSTMLEEMSKSGGMKDALALIASSPQGDRFGQMLAYLQPARRMRILSFVGNADESTIKDSVEMFFGSSQSSALVNEMWMPGQMRREIYLTQRIAEANGPNLDGLEKFHDFLSTELRKFETPDYELNQHSFYDIEEIDGKIYKGTSSGAVKIHFNKTSSELVIVGDKLRMCVGNGSYGTRASKGEILLFCFVQASNDTTMDDVQEDHIIGMVEIQRGQVLQAKGLRNSKLAPDLRSISQDVANQATKKANIQFNNLLEKGA